MTNDISQHKIIQAVDAMLRVHDHWVADPDPRFKEILPKEFETAAEDLFDGLALADVPAQLRHLVRAVEGFETEWRLYAGGNSEGEGKPRQSLYRALRGVIAARGIALELTVKRPEPVAELLRQKVSPQQIANAIYGHNGVGPFLGQGGVINFELLDKEAASPGSVVPKDWVPPYEEARLRQYHIDVRKRLATVDAAIEKSRPPRKESVDALLRDGQFIDVICTQCNVTEEQVRAIADVLELEVQTRPNLAAMRAPSEPEVSDEAASVAGGRSTRQVVAPPAKKKITITRAMKQQVLELNENGMGAPEIAAELGGKLTARQVAQLIQQSRNVVT